VPGIAPTYPSLFGSGPMTTDSAERAPIVLGVHVAFAVAGRVLGVRWFRDRNDDGDHVAIVRTPDNLHVIAVKAFHREAADPSGAERWINAYLRPYPKVAAGAELLVDVYSQKGYWWYTPALYASVDYTSGPLTVPHRSTGVFQGLFSYGHELETESDGGGYAYGVDLLYLPD
jgi:hypothetical protein